MSFAGRMLTEPRFTDPIIWIQVVIWFDRPKSTREFE
jgi:hypothetical protein